MSKKAKKTTTLATRVATTPEQAMEAIAEFAVAHGSGWRDALRGLWAGEGDGSVLYAAREVVPAAVLENLSFKPARPARPPRKLTPEQETARRLRKVGVELRKRASALQTRAKDIHAQARTLRQGSGDEVAALMRLMHDEGALTRLEAEAAR